MPYSNRDPKRDHNFDNHPETSLTTYWIGLSGGSSECLCSEHSHKTKRHASHRSPTASLSLRLLCWLLQYESHEPASRVRSLAPPLLRPVLCVNSAVRECEDSKRSWNSPKDMNFAWTARRCHCSLRHDGFEGSRSIALNLFGSWLLAVFGAVHFVTTSFCQRLDEGCRRPSTVKVDARNETPEEVATPEI